MVKHLNDSFYWEYKTDLAENLKDLKSWLVIVYDKAGKIGKYFIP